MNPDGPRLIEVAFPLKQVSLDSLHEKNVRHGHISTLHIWPARRPLAACRAVLIATLLPDPGTEAERARLMDRLAGRIVKKVSTRSVGGTEEPVEKECTEGGILHWGRESGPDLEFFRSQIRKVFGGRAPRVLDPFAGGGAIPLEAMRLGCQVRAVDINPVAWLILKCTLEYPQRFAGQTLPMPPFARDLLNPELFGKGRSSKKRSKRESQQQIDLSPAVGLSQHVLLWGHWVLERARRDLERFYPVVDGKTTVAYLWARTVTCKNCRATVPLLKTLWLCRKPKKRVRLEIVPRQDRSGVDFQIVREEEWKGSEAQRREYDRRVGRGTMSRAGAWCPVCGRPGTVAMTLDDIRSEAGAGRLGAQMTAVVVDGSSGKEYRLPTAADIEAAAAAADAVSEIFAEIPFGLPSEPLPSKEALGFRVPRYGFKQWSHLFTPRQLAALGTFLKHTRDVRHAMRDHGYPDEWMGAVLAYLSLALDRLADRASGQCRWDVGYEKVDNTFSRFALPMVWDYCEVNPLSDATGNYRDAVVWVAKVLQHLLCGTGGAEAPSVEATSATGLGDGGTWDLVFTDPPYYDAIPYSDTMDFFYVWLRRCVGDLNAEMAQVFREPLGPKWDHDRNDGELVDDPSRFGGDASRSRQAYEEGMYRAFRRCYDTLAPGGSMVVVFAHKDPVAWETLVSSIIRAGFVVTASWPIQTEMNTRMRARESAALASSVWLVCRKRPETAPPGWDTRVLEAMRSRIYERLQAFWDAGIRGPDFVWAATGPALEAYSKYPLVKKANEPNRLMSVSEFLHHVRRIVVDYVVGRVLSADAEAAEMVPLDNLTIYYLLH
ncbi:MAG: DUF1156 domain-containing protein, partial [Bacillota bacterium]